jgi:hypothetical protein
MISAAAVDGHSLSLNTRALTISMARELLSRIARLAAVPFFVRNDLPF